MLAEFTAALGSLKATTDIVKGLNAVATETKLNEVKLELQRALLDAQMALSNAQAAEASRVSRVTDLEQEIVQLKDWSAEKERYQLRDAGRGAFTYMPKPGMENGEPPHWLCPNCFGHRRKSFLQFQGQMASDSTYRCDACKSSMIVRYTVNPAKMPEVV